MIEYIENTVLIGLAATWRVWAGVIGLLVLSEFSKIIIFVLRFMVGL